MRNVYITLNYGDAYRDVVRLGMLRHLVETYPDIRAVVLTPAFGVEQVREETRMERVELRPNEAFFVGTPLVMISELRHRWRKSERRRRWLTRLAERWVPERQDLQELFREFPPSLVVSTHTEMSIDLDVVVAARRRGVPTMSVLRSWDHLHKQLKVRGDTLCVGNRANYREALELHGFRPDDVRLLGSMAFDRYFTPGVVLSREEAFGRIGLDPARPVLLFGTAGPLGAMLDETHLLEFLIRTTDEHPALRDAQIVCRLHPLNQLQHYIRYAEHPRVTLSYGTSSVPTMGWSMSRDEVDGLANLLRHADVVITPASTLAIEAPVFDTPTLISSFSLLQPGRYQRMFQIMTFSRHFRPIVENDWLPVARAPEELGPMIVRALEDRSWYAEGRRAVVDEFCTFTDGRSYQRVAARIDELSRA
jgi:hypothetical protein